MKLKVILFSSLSALFLTSCADVLVSDEKPILLSASNVTMATRAGIDIQGTTFDEDEKINVYITSDVDQSAIGNPTVCTTSAPSDGMNSLSPDEQPYYPNGSTPTVSIFALYPKSVTKETTSFSVKSDQTSDANYKASDLMTVPKFKQVKTSDIVNLGFSHKLTKLIIKATAEEGYNITGITLKGLYRGIKLDTETGLVDNTQLSDQGPITMTNGGAVVFPPQTINIEEFIEVQTNEGNAIFGIANKEFVGGHQYSLNLAVGVENIGKNNYTIPTWNESDGEITVGPNGGDAGMTADDISSQTYTGELLTPKPANVYWGESKKKLTENTDYVLNYVDNLNVGTAQVLITGVGYYAGITVVKSFEITKAAGTIKYPATTKSQDYTIGGKITDFELTKTGDGEVSFSSSNTNVATVNALTGEVSIVHAGTTTITATVVDGDNYKYAAKTASYTLTVGQRDASNLTIQLGTTTYDYDGTAKQPTVTVTDNGTQLIQGTDYTLTYSSNTNAGTAKATITAINTSNYKNSKDATFTINKLKATLTIKNTQAYLNVSATMTRLATASISSPAVPIKYKSSATGIATIDASTGVLTGKATGSTKVTAYVDDTNFDVASVSYDAQVVNIVNTFAYSNNNNQTFTATYDGVYKLEVWGAQGGGTAGTVNGKTTYVGGKGGYSRGTVTLTANQKIYVVVGGQGIGDGTHTYRAGGYNGGGNAESNNDGNTRQLSGGGATHMATTSRGVLSNYESYKSEVLIVAGGGGGSGGNAAIMFTQGGYGGGQNGGNGSTYDEGGNQIFFTGYGATQEAGGSGNGNPSSAIFGGAFGQGGSSQACGGGGGYYGGGAAAYSAGGGSGWIGTGVTGETIGGDASFPNTAGSANETGHSGNGYAKISFVTSN